jgi:hypothetical protein
MYIIQGYAATGERHPIMLGGRAAAFGRSRRLDVVAMLT